MKYYSTQFSEYVNKNKRIYIKAHLLECYDKLQKGENIDAIIRSHKNIINSIELIGKNKNNFKTLTYLQHYRNTKNKVIANMVLTNTLNNMRCFS
tara:strand:- start:152 stop:436 length:285 start_codon:yes stop_codon:yes gene_type:complete